MTWNLRSVLMIFAQTCLIVGTAFAQTKTPERWVLLANIPVLPNLDKASTDLSEKHGSIKAIRLVARSAPVTIIRITLKAEVDKDWIEDRTIELRPGERTKQLFQDGSEYFPLTMSLLYKAIGHAKNSASLEVWALQSMSGARPSRPEKIPPPRWPSIGTRPTIMHRKQHLHSNVCTFRDQSQIARRGRSD